jgi:hypothetical protein
MFGTGGALRAWLPFVCMSSPIGTMMLAFHLISLRLQFANYSSPGWRRCLFVVFFMKLFSCILMMLMFRLMRYIVKKLYKNSILILLTCTIPFYFCLLCFFASFDLFIFLYFLTEPCLGIESYWCRIFLTWSLLTSNELDWVLLNEISIEMQLDWNEIELDRVRLNGFL